MVFRFVVYLNDGGSLGEPPPLPGLIQDEFGPPGQYPYPCENKPHCVFSLMRSGMSLKTENGWQPKAKGRNIGRDEQRYDHRNEEG